MHCIAYFLELLLAPLFHFSSSAAATFASCSAAFFAAASAFRALPATFLEFSPFLPAIVGECTSADAMSDQPRNMDRPFEFTAGKYSL